MNILILILIPVFLYVLERFLYGISEKLRSVLGFPVFRSKFLLSPQSKIKYNMTTLVSHLNSKSEFSECSIKMNGNSGFVFFPSINSSESIDGLLFSNLREVLLPPDGNEVKTKILLDYSSIISLIYYFILGLTSIKSMTAFFIMSLVLLAIVIGFTLILFLKILDFNESVNSLFSDS